MAIYSQHSQELSQNNQSFDSEINQRIGEENKTKRVKRQWPKNWRQEAEEEYYKDKKIPKLTPEEKAL